MAKNEFGSQRLVVARWVRPAIEHAQDGPLVRETRGGVIFMVSFCRVPFCVQPFVSFLLLVFLFFVLAVSFSQKSNLLVRFCLLTFCVLFDCGKTLKWSSKE